MPVDHVIAIYARENGQGMAFPVPSEAPAGMTPAPSPETTAPTSAGRGRKLALADKSRPDAADGAGQDDKSAPQLDDSQEPPPEPPTGGRPALKRIK